MILLMFCKWEFKVFYCLSRVILHLVCHLMFGLPDISFYFLEEKKELPLRERK